MIDQSLLFYLSRQQCLRTNQHKSDSFGQTCFHGGGNTFDNRFRCKIATQGIHGNLHFIEQLKSPITNKLGYWVRKFSRRGAIKKYPAFILNLMSAKYFFNSCDERTAGSGFFDKNLPGRVRHQPGLHRRSIAFNDHFAPVKEVALKYVCVVTLVDFARG